LTESTTAPRGAAAGLHRAHPHNRVFTSIPIHVSKRLLECHTASTVMQPKTRRSHESLVHAHAGMPPPPPPPAAAAGTPTSPRRPGAAAKTKRLSTSATALKDPFYRAASCAQGTTPAMYFEAKYYGPCPEIPTTSEAPAECNVGELLRNKKEAGDQIRCNLYFSEKGITVLSKDKSATPIVCWKTMDVASCATIKHPYKKGRRVGLLKVRDPTSRRLMWYLFKYCCGRADNMTDCFRYIVDCSLREIGRAVTTRAQQDAQAQLDLRALADSTTDGNDTGDARPAWPEPDYDDFDVPPRYEPVPATKRQLRFGHVNDKHAEARAEAEDIARSAARCSAAEFVYQPIRGGQ